MAKNKTPMMIVGTSAEARIAQEIADQLDVLVYGYLTDDDDELNMEINDLLVVAVLGSKDSDTLLQDEHVKMVIGAPNAEKRRELVEDVKGSKPEIITLVHPLARVSQHAKLEKGNILHAGVIIPPNVIAGEFNYFGAYVSVGVDTEIGEYCTIQDGVRIGQTCVIEDEVYIGHGAIIHPGVKIGDKAMVAAGSVVMQDIPANTSVFGNPAKRV